MKTTDLIQTLDDIIRLSVQTKSKVNDLSDYERVCVVSIKETLESLCSTTIDKSHLPQTYEEMYKSISSRLIKLEERVSALELTKTFTFPQPFLIS